MSNIVLHVHLGPVQTFIAEARRTRDIWAGSFILSWLSAEALDAALGPGKHAVEKRVRMPASAVTDITVHAVRTKTTKPFLGTFPNHFEVELLPTSGQSSEEIAADAIARVEARVRDKWIKLAGAVEELIFDTVIDWRTLGELHPPARKLFQAQIGTLDATPMWEIYAIAVEKDKWEKTAGDASALDLRKLQRWSGDIARTPGVQTGALCSMIPGWCEISAVEDFTRQEGKDLQHAFWEAVRGAVVAQRYGGAAARNRAVECLDITPKERLSAPALVKRLFPLLDDETLERIIGWTPVIRASAFPPVKEQSESSRRGFLSEFLSRLRLGPHSPQVAPAKDEARAGPLERDDVAGRQERSLWPSTSYMAAARWIARAHRCAPAKAQAVANAIAACGRHLEVAEETLFVRCTSEGPSIPLAPVDGACLFPTSVERMAKDLDAKQRKPFDALIKALSDLAAAPIDPDRPNGPRIGGPAPVYAIVRADGDEMGRRLKAKPDLSQALGRFTERLRAGAPGDVDGVITRHNGVPLYASADEMIAICPLEDALALARDVRESFRSAVAGIDDEATLSVAITYAHRQVPLSWVMQSGLKLLDKLAKDGVGGDALAVEAVEAGGRKVEWVAHWEPLLTSSAGGTAGQNPEHPSVRTGGALRALSVLLDAAFTDAPAIGGNPFLHSFAARLGPMMFEDDSLSCAQRVGQVRLGSHSRPPEPATPPWKIALTLSWGLVADACPQLSRPRIEELAAALVAVSATEFRDENRKPVHELLRLSPSGMKLLRLLVENDRRFALAVPSEAAA